MTETEIKEGNILIANFMFAIHYKNTANEPDTWQWTSPPFTNSTYILFGVEAAKFHSLWDWLMPVVEKIESTNKIHCTEYYPYMVTMWKSGCKISDGNNGYEITEGFSSKSKIDAVWTAIVQFIEWYNQQKDEKVT